MIPRLEADLQIPPELAHVFVPLLRDVYTGVCSKFEDWTKISELDSLGPLDSWIRSGISEDFKDFVKNDVLFLYSHFAIKKLQAIIDHLAISQETSSNEVLYILAN